MQNQLPDIARQRQGLDFVVLGSARGGTTAVVRLINANPKLYCSAELFSVNENLATLDIPDVVFAKIKARGGRYAEEHWPLLTRKASSVLIGDKQINYMFNLSKSVGSTQKRKGIFCYREAQAVVISGNARAAKATDPWPSGRIGALLAIDTIIGLMSVCADINIDCLVAPYNKLVEAPEDLAQKIYGYLLDDATLNMIDYPPEKINERWRQQRAAFNRVAADAADIKVLRFCRFDEIDAIFYEPSVEMLSNVRPYLQSILDGFGPDFITKVAALVAEGRPAEVRKYIKEEWEPSRCRLYTRLYRRIQHS